MDKPLEDVTVEQVDEMDAQTEPLLNGETPTTKSRIRYATIKAIFWLCFFLLLALSFTLGAYTFSRTELQCLQLTEWPCMHALVLSDGTES